MSHGTGGSLASHYDTALALAHAGYVAAALTHPGDNYRDRSRAADVAARPAAIRDAITFMLTQWSGRAALDASKIGVFGFSSGGLTALVLIGAVPDLSTVGAYCESHASAFVCGVARSHPPTRRILASDWVSDTRIKAAVVAAPALGFAFGRDGRFLAPCSDELARVAPDVCAEVGGFDRAAFHAAFDAEVVRFFDRALR